MSNYMEAFVQYQTSLNSVKSDSYGIAGEQKTKLLVNFFCGNLHKEELAEDDKSQYKHSFMTI